MLPSVRRPPSEATTLFTYYLADLMTIEEIQQLTLWFCCLEPWQEEGLRWVYSTKVNVRFVKQGIYRWLR
jgi:hypothetical protein